MADVLANPIVVGLLIGLPSFGLGYLGYRRSQQVDKATASSDAIGQIVAGLNMLIDNLQDDNVTQREQIIACRDQVETLRARLEAAAVERDKLKHTIASLGGGLGIVLLLALLIGGSGRVQQQQIVERAVQAERRATKAAVTQEVTKQVRDDIHGEVSEQLDERLLAPSTIPTHDLPPEFRPVDPATTTTVGPYDPSTTTTSPPPPDTSTTITIPEVPTTVTIPEGLPAP